MPETKDITSEVATIFSNNTSTELGMNVVYNSVTVNEAPVVNSPIFIDIDQDTVFYFSSSDILDAVTDTDNILTLKIEEVPKRGHLRMNGTIEVPNEQVINFSEINLLGYTPPEGETGAVFSSVKMRIKDDGDQPRPYSDIFEVIFNVIPINQEPTVSDETIEVEYGETVTLTTSLFIKDYLDPEGDPFGYIIIYTLPLAGQGRILFSSVPVVEADLPLTVTALELAGGDLEYEDTGENIGGKDIDINFEIFDNV
jgi:hypothetical protein